MIEYHGWATIRESFSEKYECKILSGIIIGNIKDKISLIGTKSSNPFINLNALNGEWHFSVSGSANHKSQDWFDIIELFEWIAGNAVGSYGLLYLYDDEDREGFDNVFQVYILKKGNIMKKEDAFLSPYIPEIEIIQETD